MIGEALISMAFSIFRLLFGALEIIDLPFDMLSTLSTVLVYGNWVIGLDLILIFVGTVVFWWGVKMSIGLAVWVWEHLPLT